VQPASSGDRAIGNSEDHHIGTTTVAHSAWQRLPKTLLHKPLQVTEFTTPTGAVSRPSKTGVFGSQITYLA
jgi:hypothetical protein